MLEELVPVLQ